MKQRPLEEHETSCSSPRDRQSLPCNPLVDIGRASLLCAMMVLVSSPVLTCAFSVTPNTVVRPRMPSSLLVSATRDTDNVVQPVQPRRFISKEDRQEAINAMDRQNALTGGVDAQMLELLSDQFLYPTKPPPKKRERPRGRPESVPGAMGYEAMLKLREAEEQGLSTIVPYATAPSYPRAQEATAPSVSPTPTAEQTEKSKRQQYVRGAKEEEKSNVKKRKKVVKNLPEPRDRSAEEDETRNKYNKKPKRVGKTEKSVDLQRYYQTELLTAREEYTLGMQVHFMMKCEDVHEGLATRLMRLPTMVEWAEACGFREPDPTFVQTEGDEQIRPAGSESLFMEQDPQMFVGNGLATEAGPGRGRGRVKKPPAVKLGPYYDDSELKFEKGPFLTERSKRGKLVNTGTVTDFVEIMLTGREAKQRMVQSNMRLVVSIARKYSNVGVNLQDLVQEGSLGLTRATEKFEPQKGFKFSTYASWWIQQAVFRSIAYHSRTIRLPVHVHNLLNRIRRIRMALERDLGRTPTDEEMAKELEMSTAKYSKMIHLTRRAISLEVPKYQQNPKDLGHESEDLLGESISSTEIVDETNPEKRVDRGLFHEDLREMLKILEEDERRVICARYGLADGLTRTVTAVAAQMKQSKAWVRSQECRALRKLRRPWYEKRLKEHQDALTN